MSALDFLWKLLVVISLSSVFFFGSFSLGAIAFKGLRGRFLRQWSRLTISTFIFSTVSFALLLLSFDQGLELGCFNQFVKSQGSMGVTRILAVIWSCGFLAWFGMDLYRHHLFMRMLKKEALEELPEFTLTTNQIMPMSYGVFVGRVAVPQSVFENSERLKHVLAHELTHTQARDGVWNILAVFCQRLCWFNPLMGLFRSQFSLFTEMATDELAIEKYNLNPKQYAEHLLALIKESSLKLPAFVSGASAEFSQMQKRLVNINQARGASTSNAKWGLAFITLLLWLLGVNQSWASIQVQKPLDPSEMVCMQIEHEMVIEKLLLVKPESNKCE